jgi:membrane-associated HD superfamily phosphohydrolase
MPSSFFDKIKLFKPAEIQPGAPRRAGRRGEGQTLFRRLTRGPWIILAVTAAVIAIVLTTMPSRGLSALDAGAVAPADVVAPFDLIIEDAEATARKKEEAAAAVLPVYTYDPNVFANTEDKIRALFAEGRAWTARFLENHRASELRTAILDKLGIDLEQADVASLIRLKFPAELEEVLVTLAAKTFSRGIVLAKNLFIHGEAEQGLTLLDLEGTERTVRVGDLLDIGRRERFAADSRRSRSGPERPCSELVRSS